MQPTKRAAHVMHLKQSRDNSPRLGVTRHYLCMATDRFYFRDEVRAWIFASANVTRSRWYRACVDTIRSSRPGGVADTC